MLCEQYWSVHTGQSADQAVCALSLHMSRTETARFEIVVLTDEGSVTTTPG